MPIRLTTAFAKALNPDVTPAMPTDPMPSAARPGLKPLDQAMAELLTHAVPLVGAQTVSTFDADGRVLAQDLVSSLDVPAHDNSSMDGYALRCADWLGPDTAPVPGHRRQK